MAFLGKSHSLPLWPRQTHRASAFSRSVRCELTGVFKFPRFWTTGSAVLQIARQPMQFGTSVLTAACVLGLAPGSPCAKDEPLDAQHSMKKNAAARREELASEDDDRLLIRAKAALKRQDAKSALELLDEHERRFPKSKNAEIREQLRKMAVR